MSQTALVLLCLGGVLLVTGVGLACRYRPHGGANVGRGRRFLAVLVASVGAGLVLAPLLGVFLVSRLG